MRDATLLVKQLIPEIAYGLTSSLLSNSSFMADERLGTTPCFLRFDEPGESLAKLNQRHRICRAHHDWELIPNATLSNGKLAAL